MISLTNFAKSLVFAAVIAEIVLHYIERYRKCKQNSGHLNEVMFFTDKGVECKEHCYRMISCDKKSCSYFNMRYTSPKLLLDFNYAVLLSLALPDEV